MRIEHMNDKSKEYSEGWHRAIEEDYRVEPGLVSNPYDPWFPSRAAEWESGYNEARKHLTSSNGS